MAHLPASSRSSTCTILKEAISLFAKNPRVLSSLLLISLFTGSLLFSVFEFFSVLAYVARISSTLATTDTRRPAYSELHAAFLGVTKGLLSVELVYLVVASAITYTLTAVNICALSAAQAGKPQETLREVLRDAKPSLAGALLTQLLVAVLNFGYIFVAAISMAVMRIYYLSDRSAWWLALAAALGVAAVVWWMYLMMVIFPLSVVVSVVERGTRGWKAISRAEELIRGSKWQGVGIVVVLVVVGLPVAVAHTAATRWLHLGLWGQLCVGLVSVVAMKVVNFVELGAFVVLHSGCKKRHEEEAAVARKLGYVSVPTADVV